MKRVRLLGEWIKGKYGRGVLTGLLTFLCLLALTYVSESRGLADGFGKGIAPVLLAGFIAWLLLYFGRLRDKRLKVISGIGGILLAFSHVYGNYLHYVNDLFVSPAVTVQQLFAVAGVGLFTVPLFALLMEGPPGDGDRAGQASFPEILDGDFCLLYSGVFVLLARELCL